jgi:ribonuclease P protein component
LDAASGHVRVAIVVPKFNLTAVRRNKLKRRLRELARQTVLPQTGSYDLLIRARRDAYDATFDQLRAEIGSVAAQLQ